MGAVGTSDGIGSGKRDGGRRTLPPAAARALAEAEARRAAADVGIGRPPEVNGRPGPEPTRFGDWEKNGIVSDF